MKWALELSEYDLSFEPRTRMKGQVLVDFIVELTFPDRPDKDELSQWTMFVDGSSNDKGCGVGVLLLTPGGMRFDYALRFNFRY